MLQLGFLLVDLLNGPAILGARRLRVKMAEQGGGVMRGHGQRREACLRHSTLLLAGGCSQAVQPMVERLDAPSAPSP